MNLKVRLSFMSFLEFAVWGCYLTCMGIYLSKIGMGGHIGSFFATQGIVSLFMPALMGIVADRWIPAQRLLGYCHLLAGTFMILAAWYGYQQGNQAEFIVLYGLYSTSVAFFMPTIALFVECGCLLCLDNSRNGYRETVSVYPCIWHDRIHSHDVVGGYP